MSGWAGFVLVFWTMLLAAVMTADAELLVAAKTAPRPLLRASSVDGLVSAVAFAPWEGTAATAAPSTPAGGPTRLSRIVAVARSPATSGARYTPICPLRRAR